MEKVQRIFRRQVAYQLRAKGFKWIRKEPHRYKPWMEVYVFADTKELQATIHELDKQRKGEI